MPAKMTLLRWAAIVQPLTLQALLDRAAVLAQQAKVTRARKLRVDSTCVQIPIHHPTDTGVLGDGVRVLPLLMRQAKPLVQNSLASVRDAFRSRLRATRRVLQQLHRVRQSSQSSTGEDAAAAQQRLYTQLLEITRQTVHQAQRVQATVKGWAPGGVAPTNLPAPACLARRLLAQFDRFLPLVRQARARVLDGQPVRSSAKVLSLFEPHTRVVKQHKLGDVTSSPSVYLALPPHMPDARIGYRSGLHMSPSPSVAILCSPRCAIKPSRFIRCRLWSAFDRYALSCSPGALRSYECDPRDMSPDEMRFREVAYCAK